MIQNRPYAYDVTEGRPGALGSNVALPCAPSPSMQPAGQPLHAIPPGWPGPAHWLRGWAPMRSASTTRARSATCLDPQHGVVVMETWRQCIRSIRYGKIRYEEGGSLGCEFGTELMAKCNIWIVFWWYLEMLLYIQQLHSMAWNCRYVPHSNHWVQDIYIITSLPYPK